MTESTLTPLFSELQDHVSYWFEQVAHTDSANATVIDEVISRGIRLYMAPPILPGERKAHTWSWITPDTTLDVIADPSGTTTTALTTNAVVIDSTATFTTSWAAVGANRLIGKTITVVVNGTSVTGTILTVDSATQVSINTNWTTAQISGASTSDTYSIATSGDIALPHDHGGIIGNLNFSATTSYPPVMKTSESRIRNLRQSSLIDQTQRPYYYALRPALVALSSPTTTYELMLWPRPDASYTLEYKYVIQYDLITGASDVLPGGLRNSEALIGACLAIAERYAMPGAMDGGQQWNYFMTVLASAISLDRSEMMAENLGPNLDRSDDAPHSLYDHSQAVTYLGVTYPT